MAFSKKCLGFLEALATAHRLDISFRDSAGTVLRTAFAPQKWLNGLIPRGVWVSSKIGKISSALALWHRPHDRGSPLSAVELEKPP
jgi:hypothetical protein